MDICGRKRGQMMVAIRWPPKAGRVIFRLVFSSNLVLSTSMLEVVRRKFLYFSTSTSDGAVGGQTGVQTGCAAGAEVAAQVGRTDQHDLGLLVMMRSHSALA